MLKSFHLWRHRRSQRRGALKLPHPRAPRESVFRENFGNYLSQSSVRGRTLGQFDLSRRRKRRLKRLLLVLLAAVLAWLVYESVAALQLFRN